MLATSRFLQDDAGGALEAWNQVGEPRVDLLRVNGLTHTRQRVVERLIFTPGAVLERSALAQATRRLSELPSAVNTRLEYAGQRRPGGASHRVFERPVVPSSRLGFLGLEVAAASRREIALPIASMSGGGEQIVARWRFWPGRPSAGRPSPLRRLGGVWGVEASYAEQPFDAAIPTAYRTTATVSVSDWATPRLRWTLRGGLDRVERRFARAGGVRIVTLDERLELAGDGDA